MELGEAALTSMTTRYFTADPVSDETLEQAFDYARHAPQGGNRQPVRFIVVRDEAKRQQLQEWYLEPWKAYLGMARSGDIEIVGDKAKRLLDSADYFAEHFAEVPVIVVACGYIDGVHPTDTELGRLSVVGGGSIYPAVQNFLLGCREAGLGTALTTLLCMYEPQVAEMLDIPEGVATAAHIAVGYRSTPFPRKLDRLPLSEIVFDETWGNSTY